MSRWRWVGWVAGVLGIAVVAVSAVCVGGGYLLEPRIELGTERHVAAPPEALWPLLATSSGIATWWAVPGSGMQVVAQPGPDAGEGLVVTFEAGGSVMETWTLKDAEEPKRVVYDVDFAGMMVVERTISLQRDASGTRVSWNETGSIDNPVFRWMTVLMPPEDVVRNFDAALGALEAAAQTSAKTVTPSLVTAGPDPDWDIVGLWDAGPVRRGQVLDLHTSATGEVQAWLRSPGSDADPLNVHVQVEGTSLRLTGAKEKGSAQMVLLITSHTSEALLGTADKMGVVMQRWKVVRAPLRPSEAVEKARAHWKASHDTPPVIASVSEHSDLLWSATEGRRFYRVAVENPHPPGVEVMPATVDIEVDVSTGDVQVTGR